MSTVRLTEAARTVTSDINCNSEAENVVDCYKSNSLSMHIYILGKSSCWSDLQYV